MPGARRACRKLCHDGAEPMDRHQKGVAAHIADVCRGGVGPQALPGPSPLLTPVAFTCDVAGAPFGYLVGFVEQTAPRCP